MNGKASAWLRLAQHLREQSQQRQQSASLQKPSWFAQIEDPELREFLEERQGHLGTVDGCRRLEVEAVYQAVLAAPEEEAKILQVSGFAEDPKRSDALYRHAEEYTREIETAAARQERVHKNTSRSVLGRIFQVTALFFLLVALGVGGWGYLQIQAMRSFIKSTTGVNKGNVEVEIPRGATAEIAIQKLKDAGVLTETMRFTLLTRFLRVWRLILPELKDYRSIVVKAGRYQMPTEQTPLQIIETLRKGPARASIRVTIPEGFNIWKIAARLEKLEICRQQDFLRLAQNAKHVAQLVGWQTPSAEGYLYPDTYRFHKNEAADIVLQRMIERFKAVYYKNFVSAVKEKGWTPHQVITLASIIEKETGRGFERPQISMVFHNRMRRNWKLETDPTVIYGLMPNFNGNLTRRDLHNPHPYNTYQHRGLPPGPIASPGFDSIRAALFPRAKRACIIFFVSKNDGTHVFSCTKQEHERFVDIYQRKIRPAPRP